MLDRPTDDEQSQLNEAEAERPNSTLAEGFFVSVSGWPDEDSARRFGSCIWALAHELSRYLNLSRLERIFIAWDYEDAVSSVDRGEGYDPASVTRNEYGQGGGIAIHTVRDGELKHVVVMHAGLVEQLADPDHPDYYRGLHFLIHELSHVSDLSLLSDTFPGGWQAATGRDGRESVLIPVVNSCQSEYLAQRRAAWAAPQQGLLLLDMLSQAMADVDRQIRTARTQYRSHGNMDVFWPEVAQRTSFLFYALGLVLGHTDWVAEEAERHPELMAQYQAKLEQVAKLPSGWLIDVCREAVQPFWMMERWTGMEVFEPLLIALERFLNQYSIYTRPNGDGVWIDMPINSIRETIEAYHDEAALRIRDAIRSMRFGS